MQAAVFLIAMALAGHGSRVQVKSGFTPSPIGQRSVQPWHNHCVSRGGRKVLCVETRLQSLTKEELTVGAARTRLQEEQARKDLVMFSIQRRALISTLLGGLASTMLPTLPLKAEAAPVSAVVRGGAAAVRVFSVAAAALDVRKYRGLILANGLRVLLASDPELSNGAASMNVQVGYMTDPATLPGVAHFCEHMLFLGTKPFPNEGDFERLVAQAGGVNNAYTAAEETNYFFDVQGDALQSVLERFAAFFTDPLFTPSATSREINAIDSEHSKNLQSDFWRFDQLLKLRADQSHPYAHFSTGNRKTLRNGDSSARAALLDFHKRYYQADRMALALIGPQPLDALQKLAVGKFSAVNKSNPALPPASDAYDGLSIPFQPSSSPAEATLMVPVEDVRALKLVWCMPVQDLQGWLKSKPEELWVLLVRNRGKGGLQPLLKQKGLALGVDANIEEFTRSWILLSMEISLTPLGLTNWRDVVSLAFAYLRKLRDSGVPESLQNEFPSIANTNFEFAEPGEAQSFATSFSSTMDFYPPEQWITGPILIEEGSNIGAEYMLQQCSEPANALITLIAKSNQEQATYTEPIYGTRYGKLSLSREIDAWRTAKIPSELSPPEPNPFIPTDFSIKCRSGGSSCVASKRDGSVIPSVIEDNPARRIHFLQDQTFQRPRANAFFFFRSPIIDASPKSSVVARLYQSVFADVLTDSTYQAGLAGLSAGVGFEFQGFSVTASGYNDRLPALATYVSEQVRSANLTALAFDRQREALRQDLANFNLKGPTALCAYRRGLALETPRNTAEELLKAIETVTLKDLLAFQKALLPESSLEAFVIGNLDETEVTKMVESVTQTIPSSGPLPADRIPYRQVRVLQPGQRYLRQFVAPNPDEADSATEVYIQIGVEEGDNWLCLGLLSQIIEQPFYEELRTKQQLGYIVQSSVADSEGVRGLIFNIQGSVLPPPQVEERINAFLTKYRGELAAKNEIEFSLFRESLAQQVTDVDRRLGQQASRLWNEIFLRRYDYNRPWRAASRLRKVTKKQLLDLYDRAFVPGGKESRRLSTHVFARQVAPSELVVDPLPDNFYPSRLDQPLPAAALKGKKLNA